MTVQCSETMPEATNHDVRAFVGIIRVTRDGLSITHRKPWRVESEGPTVDFFNGKFTKVNIVLPKVIPEFDSYTALNITDRSGLLRELERKAEELKIHERLLPYITTTAP